MPVEVSLLGNFALKSNGAQPRALPPARLQSLIAYLALHPETPLLRSQLAYYFWPDSTEAQAHTNLRKAIHDVRQLLPQGDHSFKLDTTSLQFGPHGVHVDVNESVATFNGWPRARSPVQGRSRHAA